MYEQRIKKEPNFIEKRRQWKAGIDKPLGKRTVMAALPAIALCVFALMSAPYLHQLMKALVKEGDSFEATPLSLVDAPAAPEIVLPPPSPDAGMAEFYQQQLSAEGFDWRKRPEIEGPDLSYARERPVVVSPVPVELPATALEVERMRQDSAARSE